MNKRKDEIAKLKQEMLVEMQDKRAQLLTEYLVDL